MSDRPLALRFRRAADFTALRLGRAVLGYLTLMMAIITLAPFRFQLTPAHGLTSIWSWSDLVMNVLMFVPFGFVHQLTRPRGAPPEWFRVLLLGGSISAGIELLQLFAPSRYTSLLDVATNAVGALLGAWLFTRLARHVDDEDAVQSLALELPLMGLVYQLVPLAWLIGLGSEGATRRWLLLAVAAMAGLVLGTVHAAYVVPRAPRRTASDRRWLVATVLGWAAVALVPGARGDLALMTAGLVAVAGMALLRSLATSRMITDVPGRFTTQRFEVPTLRLVLPLFAVYLTLSSLWPLSGDTTDWRGTLALALPGVALSQPFVFRALEQVAAFTLAGYISAEFHGRDVQRFAGSVPRLLVWTASVSLLLQVARGFYAAHGASLLLFALTQVAALFGAWLYGLQRAHVRALVQRRELLATLLRESRAPVLPARVPAHAMADVVAAVSG